MSRIAAAGLKRSGIPQKLDPVRAENRNPKETFDPPRLLMGKARIERQDFASWPNFKITPSVVERSILYLHGGAYAVQILPAQWRFVARLAQVCRAEVTIPIYPLAPEHSHRDIFPTLHDLYADLVSKHGRESLTLLGDSAGAGMALALCQQLPEELQPKDLVLLSPWLDVTMTDPAIAPIAPLDPMLRVDNLQRFGEMYAGGDDLRTPTVSPLFGPLDRLPPTTVFSGTHDILNPDAHSFVERAAQAGTTITLHEYAEMLHDWMLIPMPEATATMRQLRAIVCD